MRNKYLQIITTYALLAGAAVLLCACGGKDDKSLEASCDESLSAIQNSRQLSAKVNQAVAEAEKRGDASLKACAYNYLAKALVMEMDYDSAYSVENKALEILGKRENPEMRAKIFLMRSTVQTLRSNYNEGMSDAQKALKLAQQNGFHNIEAQTYLAISRIDIISYRDSIAEIHAKRSRQIAARYGLAVEENQALTMLARICSLADCSQDMPNRNNEAMNLVRQAYVTAHGQRDTMTVIESSLILADIYCNLNRWTNPINAKYQSLAKAYLDEALKNARAIAAPYYITQSYRYMVRWCRINKDYKGALGYCSKIIEQVASDNYQALSQTYDQMVALNASTGDWDKALNSHELYVENVSKQSGYQTQQALQEQETRYETQQKEAHIKWQRMELIVMVFVLLVCLVFMVVINRYRVLTRRRNRELKSLNDDKDKFFSIISHDLKNPAIEQRNALQLLAAQGAAWDAATLEQFHRELLRSADSQVDLLHNLLNWAQIETGKIPFHPVPIDLSTIFSQEIKLLETMSKHKGIDFAVEMSQNAVVTADANMIRTVVRNLLTNAIKFTGKGGRIVLKVAQAAQGYEVSVTDSGVGMTAEQIENLCSVGKHNSTIGTAGEAGSGLGLVICREMIEKHGSTMNVASTKGVGTTFSFVLSSPK